MDKSRRYHELNVGVLWFYVIIIPPLKWFTTYSHNNHTTSYEVYFALKIFSFFLAFFTLMLRHVSYVANSAVLLPEFKGMQKFAIVNALKFGIVAVNTFYVIFPPDMGKDAD